MEGFDKGPEKRSYALSSAQQFNEAHHSKQSKEIDRNDGRAGLKGTRKKNQSFDRSNILRYIRVPRTTYVNLRVYDVDETSENDNEVEYVPGIAKVILRRRHL